MPRWNQSVLERLHDKFQIAGEEECWTWHAATDRDGYGRVQFAGSWQLAHRVVYETMVGQIPPGMEIDHLCRTRSCVNPRHLEIVTRAENNSRKWRARTHCKNGHELSAANVRLEAARKRRVCKVCQRESQRRRQSLTKAAAPRARATTAHPTDDHAGEAK